MVLLLATRPREGWEDIYEEVTRREVARLAPQPNQAVESPAADQGRRGADGTTTKEDSANASIP